MLGGVRPRAAESSGGAAPDSRVEGQNPHRLPPLHPADPGGMADVELQKVSGVVNSVR